MKLGKLPAAPKPTDLKFAKYDTVVATYPPHFGYGRMFADWGMLGNDRYGDCAWAGPAHETMLATKRGGRPVTFTTENVLSDYASTGFDPATGANDNGSNMHQVCDYRLGTGIVDSEGARHKIAAYLFGRQGDWDQLMRALYLFEFVGLGIEFPSSAMDQFKAEQDWDVVPGASVEGGHYISGVGTVASEREITVVTWGKRQQMTRAFFDLYCDEWVVYLSDEVIRTGGKDPAGLDWATLQADFAAVTSA